MSHDQALSQPPTTAVCLPRFLGDDGEGGNGACLFGFLDDDVEVVSGSLDERRFVAIYGRDGTVAGVLGMNRPAHVARLRPLVEARTDWHEALARARELQ